LFNIIELKASYYDDKRLNYSINLALNKIDN